NLAKAAGSRPPCFSTLSRARALSWSRFQPALATPITGTLRWPRRTIPCSAGKIFLYARSPVAPKKTRASELDAFMIDSLFRGFSDMPADPKPLGQQHFARETRPAARAEGLIERGGKNGHGNRLVDGGLNRPPPLARVRDPTSELRQLLVLDQGCRSQVQ